MKGKKSNEVVERRSCPRIDRSDPVKFNEVNLFDELDLSEENERPVDGRLLNISAGGVLLESDFPFELECLLKMEMFIPDWVKYDFTRLDPDYRFPCKPLVVVGKVVRKESSEPLKWNLGVSFVAIDEKHRKAVNRLVGAELRAH